MPRTKQDQINRKFEKVIVLIWGTIEARGIGVENFASAVKLSKTTLHRRKHNPEEFTLDELSRIGRYLGIPIEEFRQCSIKY